MTTPTAMVMRKRTGAAPGLFRLAGLTTLGSLLDATTFGTNETGAPSGISYARANDFVEFKGAEYCINTVSTTSHQVFTRPIGGPINTTAIAAATQTFTVSCFTRTGLHVSDTGSGPLLWFVYCVSTAMKLVTFDGTTWTVTTIATAGTAPVHIDAYGVCVVRGTAYIPWAASTNAGALVVNIGAATGAITLGPTSTNPKGMFTSLFGRVFYMPGETAAASQRTVYEYVGGAFVSRLVLTNGGTDTTTGTSATRGACIFPISDTKLMAIYPTNSGATASNAFWTASEIVFTGPSDIAPTEVQRTTFPPAAMTAAGGITYGIFVLIDNETDPTASTIHFFYANGAAGTYQYAPFVSSSTTLVGSATGVDATNYAIPAGTSVGGERFSPDDTANLIWEEPTFALSTANSGCMTMSFKFQAQSGTYTVKAFLSTTENPLLNGTQCTLAGTATGGSATRSGNTVTDCVSNTAYTVDVDFNSMGISTGSKVKILLTAA